jgi:hypothetical protein
MLNNSLWTSRRPLKPPLQSMKPFQNLFIKKLTRDLDLGESRLTDLQLDKPQARYWPPLFGRDALCAQTVAKAAVASQRQYKKFRI